MGANNANSGKGGEFLSSRGLSLYDNESLILVGSGDSNQPVATTDLYDNKLFSEDQIEEDPCLINFSSRGYISAQFPFKEGFYQVPSEVSIIFHLPGITNESFYATSGFIEVIGVNQDRINAYMEADYDSLNRVAGIFILDKCY